MHYAHTNKSFVSVSQPVVLEPEDLNAPTAVGSITSVHVPFVIIMADTKTLRKTIIIIIIRMIMMKINERIAVHAEKLNERVIILRPWNGAQPPKEGTSDLSKKKRTPSKESLVIFLFAVRRSHLFIIVLGSY